MSETVPEIPVEEKIDQTIVKEFKDLQERSGQSETVFLVDIEGVLYPFKFSQDRSTGKLSFIESPTITVESSRDANGKARRLPSNKHLIDILAGLCERYQQTMVASASQLNLGRQDIIAKIDPIYHSAIDGAETSLRSITKRDPLRVKSLTPSTDKDRIPLNSLLVIVNDRTEEDGTPPKTIMDNLRKQSGAETFKYIQVKPPAFVFDIEDKATFNTQVDKAFIEAFKRDPLKLPSPKTGTAFTADKLQLPSRPRIRRPGD